MQFLHHLCSSILSVANLNVFHGPCLGNDDGILLSNHAISVSTLICENPFRDAPLRHHHLCIIQPIVKMPSIWEISLKIGLTQKRNRLSSGKTTAK